MVKLTVPNSLLKSDVLRANQTFSNALIVDLEMVSALVTKQQEYNAVVYMVSTRSTSAMCGSRNFNIMRVTDIILIVNAILIVLES